MALHRTSEGDDVFTSGIHPDRGQACRVRGDSGQYHRRQRRKVLLQNHAGRSAADALHCSSGICQCRCTCEKGMEQIRRCGEESHRKLCSRMQEGDFSPAERPSLGTERQNCIDMDECLYRRLSCYRKSRLSGGDQCFLVRHAVLRHRDGKQVWPQVKRIRGEMVSGKRYGDRELPEDVLDAGQGISC